MRGMHVSGQLCFMYATHPRSTNSFLSFACRSLAPTLETMAPDKQSSETMTLPASKGSLM